jgi:hypothetical protein
MSGVAVVVGDASGVAEAAATVDDGMAVGESPGSLPDPVHATATTQVTNAAIASMPRRPFLHVYRYESGHVLQAR